MQLREEKWRLAQSLMYSVTSMYHIDAVKALLLETVSGAGPNPMKQLI